MTVTTEENTKPLEFGFDEICVDKGPNADPDPDLEIRYLTINGQHFGKVYIDLSEEPESFHTHQISWKTKEIRSELKIEGARSLDGLREVLEFYQKEIRRVLSDNDADFTPLAT